MSEQWDPHTERQQAVRTALWRLEDRLGKEMSEAKIDPVCLVHGLRKSEHVCLYCCLCFKSLTPEECNQLPDGTREDVCVPCAEMERRAR